MIEENLHHLMRTATQDVTASDSLRDKLTNSRPTRTATRRWLIACLAAAAAAAVLIVTPLLRPHVPAPTTATPPAVSTHNAVTISEPGLSGTTQTASGADLGAPTPAVSTHNAVTISEPGLSGTTQTASGADLGAPTPADITACRTDAATSPPRTHQLLLCFFVPTGAPAVSVYTTGPPPSPGALVIGVVDPVAVDDVQHGLGVRNQDLCLQRYPLWIVAGDLGRRDTSGCGDGDNWQKVIDDNADHISWTIVDSAALCTADTGISGSPINAPIRMALLCRPGAQASVLTGAAATALAAAAQLPGAGTPCALKGWTLTTVAGLKFHHVSLPTVNDASGCHLTAAVQTRTEN